MILHWCINKCTGFEDYNVVFEIFMSLSMLVIFVQLLVNMSSLIAHVKGLHKNYQHIPV